MTHDKRGWVSARNGKWHRCDDPEPSWAKEHITSCGMTFQPLNVTHHGEEPPTIDYWKCKRKGCT